MLRHLHKFESTMWLLVKCIVYLGTLGIYIAVLGTVNIGYTRMSRTLGVTVLTYIVVGALFLQIYGHYDIGRRKSKPIVYSILLATLCTDIITYAQVVIMRTYEIGTRLIYAQDFQLLIVIILLQVVWILIAVYSGNGLFFKIHEPEACSVITSSQESLDYIACAINKFKRQYKIQYVFDYRDPGIFASINNVTSVFIYDIPAQRRAEIMRLCYERKINVYFNPDIEDIMEFSAKKYILDDVYLLNKKVKSITMEQRVIKRLMDIVLPVLIGLLCSPLWIAAMIAIKVNDGGPVIFTQERVTLKGRKFKVYKLRTMKVDAEIRSADADDDRITAPGRLLRKTRIDELPQLWNVLKGDMSLVGPRPEMLKNVEAYTNQLPEFVYRLRMKGGLTGYAQIAGKYNTTPKDKLIMDMMYIEQFSIWKDIQLIFQTVSVVLKSDSTEGFRERADDKKYTFIEYVEKQG